MRAACLALVLIAAGSAALAQNPSTGGSPGPGGGNPPSGWSGGATPRGTDTGRMHPDGKGAPAAPSTATAPPHSGDIRITSDAEARRAIEAEGFTQVSTLKREGD